MHARLSRIARLVVRASALFFVCTLRGSGASSATLFQTWNGPAWSNDGPVSLSLYYLPEGEPSAGASVVQLFEATFRCKPKSRCPGAGGAVQGQFTNESLIAQVQFRNGIPCDLTGTLIGADPHIIPADAATAQLGALIMGRLVCGPNYAATLCLRRNR